MMTLNEATDRLDEILDEGYEEDNTPYSCIEDAVVDNLNGLQLDILMKDMTKEELVKRIATIMGSILDTDERISSNSCIININL